VQTPAAQVAPPEHALPQKPQLRRSVATSTQAPLQFVRPTPHESEHAPCEQTWPLQATPHPPQLFGSAIVSTQAPLQSAYPVAQVQIPAVQTWEVPQATSQPPQWAASLLMSAHPVPQSTSPGEQPGVSW
jgi:hypothetical protein